MCLFAMITPGRGEGSNQPASESETKKTFTSQGLDSLLNWGTSLLIKLEWDAIQLKGSNWAEEFKFLLQYFGWQVALVEVI